VRVASITGPPIGHRDVSSRRKSRPSRPDGCSEETRE
jgi:hypothetical protein